MIAPPILIASLMRRLGGVGVQTHVRTFETFLKSLPRAAALVTPYSSNSPLLYPIFAARLPLKQFNRPASVWWYRHWHAVFLAQAMRSRLKAAPSAVVYAQCPVSAAAALRVRSEQRVVMAIHFHGSQADDWAEKRELPMGGSLYRTIRQFEEHVLDRVDGIVYVSSFSREVLQARIPRLADVPNLVVHNTVPTIPRDEQVKIGDLITVGSLEPRKNQQYLLQVLAAANARGHRFSLTVVGTGPDRRDLEMAARRLGIGDQVRFTGHHPDARALMAQHRVYCHTAVMENFGIALLEAMSEGLPVVAAPVGGVSELVRDGLDGAHWPLDDADRAAGILVDLMNDGTVRDEMSARAAARARTDFAVEDLGTRLLAFLDETGARPVRSPRA